MNDPLVIAGKAARFEQRKHGEIGCQRLGLAVENDLDHGVR